MSLNAKGDKPETPVEVRLAELERNVKKRRGANRRRAFALLREADEARAFAVLEEITEAAAGKARAELGALLASTGVERFVDRAVRGKYGDVLVCDEAPVQVLADFVARFEAELARLSPVEVRKRARSLGLVPLAPRLVAAGLLLAGSPGARALVRTVDDERLPRELRHAAARSLAHVEPWALWGRRDELPVEIAIAVGLAAGVAVPSGDECRRFAAALRALPRDERSAYVALAKLPASAVRLPPEARVPLLAVVLDDDDATPEARLAAGLGLAHLRTAEADEAILARPAAVPEATMRVCARVDVEEARAIVAPLLVLRGDQGREARRAFANSALPRDAAFLGEALALLAVDPLASAAMLARMTKERRATEELATAIERADLDDARLMICGAAWALLGPDSHVTARRAALGDVLANAGLIPMERRPLVVELLERVRLRPGVVTDDVDAALAVLRR